MEIEVFYTSVDSEDAALGARQKIEMIFPYYQVNFDLADCDRVMRVVSKTGSIASDKLIALLKKEGIKAGLLPDIIPSPKFFNSFSF